jgi:hypothetical protein
MWEVPPKAHEGKKENGGTLHFAFPPFEETLDDRLRHLKRERTPGPPPSPLLATMCVFRDHLVIIVLLWRVDVKSLHENNDAALRTTHTEVAGVLNAALFRFEGKMPTLM